MAAKLTKCDLLLTWKRAWVSITMLSSDWLTLTYQSAGALLLGAARAPRARRRGWLGEGGGLGVLHVTLVQDRLRQLDKRRLDVDVGLKLELNE